jgi:hypothetical protein
MRSILNCIAVAIVCSPKANSQPLLQSPRQWRLERTNNESDLAIRTALPDARRADGAAALELRTPIRISKALRPDFRPV